MTDESNDASPAPENLSSEEATSEAITASTSTTESTTPEDKPTEAESSEARSDEVAAKPEVALRMRIGSMRDGDNAKDAKPKPTVAAPSPREGKEAPEPVLPEKTKYPPPNIRQQLPPELEKEVEDALGGMSLDAMIESSAPSDVGAELEPETRVEGRVVIIRREDVFLELGGRNQGVVPLKQFEEPPEPGTIVEIQIQRLNTEEGLYEASLPGAAIDVGDWEEVTEGLVVEAMITGHNKGGLECQLGKLRGFIPMSQVSLYRVEDLDPFVGKKFACVVTEANAEKRNLVLSRRAVLERERSEAKQKLIEELAVGQEREGVVTNLLDFGAFVDLGGIDGLIHISQMSWDRIGHPSEVLEVGQKVKVKITKFDSATGKIGLGYRDLMENPWTGAAEKYPLASRVRGTVTKILDFGALIRLEPGVAGLVHISELSHQRVHRVSDMVSEGQEVEVQVLAVDPDAQRMSLSMKALETAPASKPTQAESEEVVPYEPRVNPEHLKGGLDRGSGGDQFGLKW